VRQKLCKRSRLTLGRTVHTESRTNEVGLSKKVADIFPLAMKNKQAGLNTLQRILHLVGHIAIVEWNRHRPNLITRQRRQHGF